MSQFQTTQPGSPQVVAYNPAIQQYTQPYYGQPMSPTLVPNPITPNGSFTKQPSNHSLQQDPALVSQPNTCQPTNLECKNLLPGVLNVKLVKNTFWATGGNILIKIFIFVVNKFILLGLGEALMVNYITRREVKNMRIGNRMLSYKSRGNFKMALLCVVNWILNIFSCGLFYILGYSHIMYLAQLGKLTKLNFIRNSTDARIHWGKPAKVSKKKNQHLKEAVCWEPIGNGMGEFKIYSVYLGVGFEIAFLTLYFLNMVSFGLLSPLLYKIYFPAYFEKVQLGKGRFAVVHPKMISSINKHAKKRSKLKKEKIEQPTEIYPCEYPVLGFPPHPSHETYKLKLKFVPSLCDLIKFFVTINVLSYISCGLFVKCCLANYARNYMNRNIHIELESVPIEELNVPVEASNGIVSNNVEMQQVTVVQTVIMQPTQV